MTKSKAVFTSRYSNICTVTFPNEILYDDFYVDVIIDLKEKEYEAWIYHESYGVKSYMFGVDTSTNLEEFIEMIGNNLKAHANAYIDDVIER